MNRRSTRLEVIDLIRDAELPVQVKALLWAVESRGEHYGRCSTLAKDMGLGRNAYYRAKRKAEELGLLRVVRRYNSSNIVTVDVDALRAVPRHSEAGNHRPQYETPPSPKRVGARAQNGEPKALPEGAPLRSTLQGSTERRPRSGDAPWQRPLGSGLGSDWPGSAQSSPPRPASDSEPDTDEMEDFRWGSSPPPRQAPSDSGAPSVSSLGDTSPGEGSAQPCTHPPGWTCGCDTPGDSDPAVGRVG